MTPVRIGLVGYGFGGRYFHAPLIASRGRMRLSRGGHHVRGAPAPVRRGRTRPRGVRLAGGPRRRWRRGGHDLDAGGHPRGAHPAGPPAGTGRGLRQAVRARCRRARGTRRSLRETCSARSPPIRTAAGTRTSSRSARPSSAAASWATRRGSSRDSSATPPIQGRRRPGGGTLLDFGSHLVDQAQVLFGPVDLGLRRNAHE